LRFRLQENVILKNEKMKKYQCEVCGYVYDPAEGDPDNEIASGIPFESLSDEWVCPLCSEGKEVFTVVE